MNIPLNSVTLRRVVGILISVYGGLTAAGTLSGLPKAVGGALVAMYPVMVIVEHAFGITATPPPQNPAPPAPQ